MIIADELIKRAAIINEALDRYLPQADEYPGLIHESMRYSVLSDGKRLRPIMLMASAEVVGGNPEKVLAAACAVECLHAYSLVHDDLPAMDNDDYRRGKPTSHKKYGEAVAILTGDALLTHSFFLLAGGGRNDADAASVVKATGVLARAAGSMGLIGGQMVDTLSDQDDIDHNTLSYIHIHKTALLFRASLEIGAILAGAGKTDLTSLGQYGEKFGLAFQIVDDILDVEGDSAKIGKPVGSDAKNRKATFPALFGLEEARKQAHSAVREAVDSIAPFGEDANFLKHLANYILSRDR